ncbi:OsmC family protein [Dongia sp.]|uniref:OsmC family protein n=1 Tax=Dongia sp. TaxID=1977262 RepID=UPI0035B3FD5D
MKARVKWIENNTFLGESNSGHAVIMNAATIPGGSTVAPSPMEYLLLGTGGCTSIDVVMILQKGRHDIQGCECRLEAERAASDPKIFTKINMHFIVTGRNLKPEAVQRAIDLSAEKYCSASIMLGKMAEITHSFEIVAPE